MKAKSDGEKKAKSDGEKSCVKQINVLMRLVSYLEISRFALVDGFQLLALFGTSSKIAYAPKPASPNQNFLGLQRDFYQG